MSFTTLGLLVFFIWLSLAAIMALAWRTQQRTGNSGWVDTIWTFAVAATAFAAGMVMVDGALSERALLVSGLLWIWALRLGWHIAARTRGITDDPRYAKLQRDWGNDAPRHMFLLLQSQALVSTPLVLAVVLAIVNPAPYLRGPDALGLLVFLVGLAGSALADHQLRRFKQDNASPGAVCDIGLWSWSRHPNYFFECVLWSAYPLFAIDLTGSWPWGWLALLGPACMIWLLTRVSGLPPLEAHMLEKYGSTYRHYQHRTSPFLPLPPGAYHSED